MASNSGTQDVPSGSDPPSGAEKGGNFTQFMSEVKEIEKRDSVLTPAQQIERLLRPGSTYFNLNPFEVLQVDPDTAMDQIKKHYRKMSILVHPDKNPDDRDRSQKAFEILSKAMKSLNDDKERESSLGIIKEAKEKTEHELTEARKQAKKDGESSVLPEDSDPQKYKETLYKTTVKLFADYELRRRQLMERDAKERKRERETEIEQEEKVKKQKEWEKDWEQRRDDRVTNWRDFSKPAAKKKKSKNRMTFKPPKPKLETSTANK